MTRGGSIRGCIRRGLRLAGDLDGDEAERLRWSHRCDPSGVCRKRSGARGVISLSSRSNEPTLCESSRSSPPSMSDSPTTDQESSFVGTSAGEAGTLSAISESVEYAPRGGAPSRSESISEPRCESRSEKLNSDSASTEDSRSVTGGVSRPIGGTTLA